MILMVLFIKLIILNYKKDLINKTAKFVCKITAIKKPEPVEINDEFAKNLGEK